MNIGNSEHLSNPTLIGLLYEAAPDAAASTHLAACAHCQGRLDAMKTIQHTDAARHLLTHATLAAQRANIYTRLDTRATFGSRWLWAGAPLAAAAALLLMVNVGMFRSEPVTEMAEAEIAQVQAADSDTLYTDIYQSLSFEAPSGVSTVAGMFDVAEQKTDAGKN